MALTDFSDYMQDFDVPRVIDKGIPLNSVVEAHEQFGIICDAVGDSPLQRRNRAATKDKVSAAEEGLCDFWLYSSFRSQSLVR